MMGITMTFFRQNIAPLLIVLMFLVALVAVSARAFLPSDMAQPAPIEGASQKAMVFLNTVAPTHG
jgi:hypothetical protein